MDLSLRLLRDCVTADAGDPFSSLVPIILIREGDPAYLHSRSQCAERPLSQGRRGDAYQTFLISDLNRDGAGELLRHLSSCMDVQVQPAVWVSADEMGDPDLVDDNRFQARHLRPPLPSEVGIALAHRTIYEQVVEHFDQEWSVIFEDDALIHNMMDLKIRLRELIEVLPKSRPCIVNLNYTAARPFLAKDWKAIKGVWVPKAPTYTTTAYLINTTAAKHLLHEQLPIRAQADWPINSRSLLFLQESRPFVEPRPDLPSVADPTGLRAQVPTGTQFLTWSWLWYFQHRKYFQGPGDYWRGVLLPRVMRYLYRSR